jgi:hypothetical protein
LHTDRLLDEFWERVEVLKVEIPVIDVMLDEPLLDLLALLVTDAETTGKNTVE